MLLRGCNAEADTSSHPPLPDMMPVYSLVNTPVVQSLHSSEEAWSLRGLGKKTERHLGRCYRLVDNISKAEHKCERLCSEQS